MHTEVVVRRLGAVAVAVGVGVAASTGVAAAEGDGADPNTSDVAPPPSGNAPAGAGTVRAKPPAWKKPPKKTAASSGSSGSSERHGRKTDTTDKPAKDPDDKPAKDPDDKKEPVAESSIAAPAADPPSKPTTTTEPTVETPAEKLVRKPGKPARHPIEITTPEAATDDGAQPSPAFVEKKIERNVKGPRNKAPGPAMTKPKRTDVAGPAAENREAGDVHDPAPATAKDVAATGTTAGQVVAPLATTTVVQDSSQDTAKARLSLAATLTAVRESVHKALAGVFGFLGAGSTASSPSGQPTGIVGLVAAVLGWGTRRETPSAGVTTVASPEVATTALAVQPLAAAAAVVTSPTTLVGWLTGPDAVPGSVDNDTDGRFGIYGTDLGIMWDNGVAGDNPNTAIVEQRQILIAFGDTFRNAAQTADGWRNNVLLRSGDVVLSDGITVPAGIVDRPGIPDGAYSGSPMSLDVPRYAREIIGKYPYSTATQVTIIPTGAISVPGAGANGATRQYVAFMSIKQWGSPGSWTTNYSAISYSDDNGQNWTTVPQSSVRSAASGRSTVAFKSGDENFQMVSFTRPPAGSADAAAGYVFATGTPAGRNGTVYLSRVKEANILDVTKYEYWNGNTWVANNPAAATPILPGTTTSSFFGLIKKTTYPTAGELSVQYNTYLKKYVMLYTDSSNSVVMRTSNSPNGTWSAATTLVSGAQFSGLYAPMIHPWSGTSTLRKADGTAEDPQYLYWNISVWGNYNVALIKTDLSALGLTYV